MASRRHDHQHEIPSKDRTRIHLLTVPASDIDKYISFNTVRLLLSLFSLALAASDIPRAGLGTATLNGWLTQLLPDKAMYFGPFTYAMTQILRVPTNSTDAAYQYTGSVDNISVASSSLWAYKFDSMSVPLRAMAAHLNVAAYPPCVLYKAVCPSSELSLETTFAMTDQLIESIQQTYFPNIPVGLTALPIGFRTISFWVDRLHHYLMELIGHKRSESRLHAVHFYRIARDQATFNLCDRYTPKDNQPFFCFVPIQWRSPTLTGDDIAWSSSRSISLAVHVMVRLARLQRQYPDLEFDVTVVTTQIELSNRDQLLPVPTSSILLKKNGVTVLIRGRSCFNSACETLLTDEYRYERETITTDITHLYQIASFARGMSQNYVWLRILLLWLGCYKARASETKFRRAHLLKRIGCACVTFFKIPSHVIVYSSWMPAIGYAFAYLIDCDIDHLHLDSIFASMNGTYTFHFWGFIRAASVQMRNIWAISIVFKCLALMEVHWLAPPSDPWKLRHGLRTYHCQMIGWISALTILAPMRLLSFRSTDVTFFEILPASVIIEQYNISMLSDLVAEYGYRLDLKTITQASVFTAMALLAVKLLIWIYYLCFSYKHRLVLVPSTSFKYCRAHYLPYSVGTIANCASMSIFWGMNMNVPSTQAAKRRKTMAVAHALSWVPQSNKILAGLATVEANIEKLTQFHQSSVNSVASSIQSFNFQIPQPMDCSACTGDDLLTEPGCPRHEPIYQVERRTKAIWSMVRLVNLALFTDPITLFRLYFVGLPLYLYRVHYVLNEETFTSEEDDLVQEAVGNRAQPLFLLPCAMDELLANSFATEEQALRSSTRYELVDIVDSTDVPWTLLLQCG